MASTLDRFSRTAHRSLSRHSRALSALLMRPLNRGSQGGLLHQLVDFDDWQHDGQYDKEHERTHDQGKDRFQNGR